MFSMPPSLAGAIIGHVAGDFVIGQNDLIARHKQQPTWFGFCICLFHCVLWTASVMVFGQWQQPLSILVLFVTHFIQDHWPIVPWYMRNISGQSEFADGPLAPWSRIVVDSVLHLIVIWYCYVFIEFQ